MWFGYMRRTKDTLSVLALIATAALLIGGTVFGNDVEAKKKYKAKVALQYDNDCWTKSEGWSRWQNSS
jgi:hypothetical protein